MGKTVPSYRTAVEFEMERWRGFRKALPSDVDREAFDELMDMCRNNAMAGGAACNPVLFEPMVISILIAQQVRMRELEEHLCDFIWQRLCGQTTVKEQNKR